MGTRFTISQLDQLAAAGKIRSYEVKNQAKQTTTGGRKVAKLFKSKSKEKNWMAETLLTWCNERTMVLEEEYRFHEKRKWRFDWCIPALKVAFEYEGIFSEQSRHTNRKGYSKDAEKYNAAAGFGWLVFRYTAINYTNLENDLKRL